MTQPVAVIVAHGQPSDPAPAEAEIAALAGRVAAHLPGWSVRSATLAQEGALERALAGADHAFVYPLFMADGWFTQTHLPARLTAAGAGRVTQLVPFGLDPAVQALTIQLAEGAARAGGHAPGETDLLLAAHGSFRSPAPAQVAQAMAARLRAEGGFRRVEAAFIDQEPQIATVAATMAEGALCLPFFAARGGHVIDDLPDALAEGGFQGKLLDPVGLDPRVPGIIAAALEGADCSDEPRLHRA
jgi:sirohydrochlorin ferrochelatase